MNLAEMGTLLNFLKKQLPEWAPKEIDGELASGWLMVLGKYPDDIIRSAFEQAISTLTSWPAPAVMKRLCEGVHLSDEEIGSDIAARIEKAISKWGYSCPNQASDDMGAAAWEVVSRCGGWSQICDLTYERLPSARKQWREIGSIVSKNMHATGKDLPPALPAPPKPMASVLKLMPNVKSMTKN